MRTLLRLQHLISKRNDECCSMVKSCKLCPTYGSSPPSLCFIGCSYKLDNLSEHPWILNRWRQESVRTRAKSFRKTAWVRERSQLKIIIRLIDEILVGPRTRIRCYSIFNWTLQARSSGFP